MSEKLNERYAYSEEEGFFLDMTKPSPEDPSLGEELLTSEVLKLLNQNEAAQLESCDLCDEPTEYRQCQEHMNSMLISSLSDKEIDELKMKVKDLELARAELKLLEYERQRSAKTGNEILAENRKLEVDNGILKKKNAKLWDDLAAWLSLAKRQYAEMPHNEPLCPTSRGIGKTEMILGIEKKAFKNPSP